MACTVTEKKKKKKKKKHFASQHKVATLQYTRVI